MPIFLSCLASAFDSSDSSFKTQFQIQNQNQFQIQNQNQFRNQFRSQNQNQFHINSAFFDVNINSFLISNTLFIFINAFDTAVVYLNSNQSIDVICVCDTFRHLRSEVGTCAIKLIGSDSLMKSLCFSDIEVKYLPTSYNCGTCVSAQESMLDFASLSMIRTNLWNHASILFREDVGEMKSSNFSHSTTYSGGSTVNGLAMYKVNVNISYSSLAHLKGGHSIFTYEYTEGTSHHLIFQYDEADANNAIVRNDCPYFFLNSCSCISSGPLIAFTMTTFEG